MNHPVLASSLAGRLSLSRTAEQFPPLYKRVWFAHLRMFSVRQHVK